MAGSVCIAGGGLSGLATGLFLARAGMRVEVYDRRTGGGGRFHDGWQVLENGTDGTDALDELRHAGIDPGFAVVPARRAIFLDGLGGRYEVASQEPYAYFLRRGAGPGGADGWLRETAREAGVTLVDDSEAPADARVIATGPRQADGAARELVFASDLSDTIAVLFDPTVTPTGYAYLFCLGGHATFGVAQVRGVRQLARAKDLAWELFWTVFGPFRVDRLHEGGQYMNFSLPGHLRDADGRWHVGEAAGVQDFLFGLGNRLALRSAALAAAGLLDRWDARAFRRTLLRPMRNTIALRFAYERLGRRGFARFCAAAARSDFRRFLVRLQRPRALGALLARAVMAAWRERSGCRHGALCTWCRRRER
jgi:flavin-dependent dehydrogenase